jgi:hypothetical protein
MATDYVARDAAFKVRKQQLHTMAPYVCALLGEGWTVAPQKHPAVEGEGFLPSYLDLNGPDGAQLSLSAGSSYDSKGSVTGYLNDLLDGYKFWYLPHGVSRPSIGVNIGRGAKAVASEIKRRVLPDYLPLLAACNEAREAYRNRMGITEAVANRLARTIGGDCSKNRDGYRYDVHPYRSKNLKGASFDIKVSGDEVTFDRLCVSGDVAVEILQLLSRNHKEEE